MKGSWCPVCVGQLQRFAAMALSELRAQMGSNAGQWVLAATDRLRLRRGDP
jgi:hypothetical protein